MRLLTWGTCPTVPTTKCRTKPDLEVRSPELTGLMRWHMEPKLLNTSLGKSGGQAVRYETLWKVADHKLRVTVYSDSYVDQSYARIERWDGARWQEVADLASHERKTETKLYYNQSVSAALFTADEKELLRRALLILGY